MTDVYLHGGEVLLVGGDVAIHADCCCDCSNCTCTESTIAYEVFYTQCVGALGCDGMAAGQTGTVTQTTGCTYQDIRSTNDEWDVSLICGPGGAWSVTLGTTGGTCGGNNTAAPLVCSGGRPIGTVVIDINDSASGPCNQATVVFSAP